MCISLCLLFLLHQIFYILFYEGEVIRMVWPPQSPDLNPIEQIWDHVDSKIRKMCNTSKNSLWVNLQTAWNDISNQTFAKYINTMKSRCQAVIDAKGGHTRF